ncbi:hypothetical protein HPB48_020943 [Haemaphysalis longicornis]|uniref:Uncharacterized protein n=1 Tax=Haemaphysalis longicornis TaxID=44386 RepID=A0A9J6G2G5_HAELO|nr:hypothetical protein HPB48_020943 [Haemaphysalis longicornis]
MRPLISSNKILSNAIGHSQDSQRAGASDQDGRVFTKVKRAALVTCCILVVAVVFATTLTAFHGKSRHGPRAKLCLSSDCRRHAVYLENYINGSISPCEDFYGHVCSNWKEPETYGEFKITALSETALNWVNRFPVLLQQGAALLTVGKKPLEMFESCMKERYGANTRDVSLFMGFLGELKLAWPRKSSKNVSALGVLINLAVNWQMTFWWRFRFVTDSPSRRKLCIVAGDSDVLSLFIINHQKLLERRSYSDYWMYHYTTLHANSTPVPSTAEINASAIQQTDILKVLAGVQKKGLNPPAILRHRNIGELMGRVTSSLWLEELRRYLPSEYLPTANDQFFTDSLVLKGMGILFYTYSDEQLIYHLSWQFIQWYFLTLDRTPLEIIRGEKRHAEPYALLYCAVYVEDIFRPLLASIHIMSRLTRGDASQLNLALSNLVNKVRSTLDASRMQPESKQSTLSKYQDMQVRLWPPSNYFNNEETADAYSCQPTSADSFLQYWVQAHHCLRSAVGSTFHHDTISMPRLVSSSPVSYDSITNELVIAVSALGPPLYYPQGTSSMFYGGLGFLVVASALEALDPTSLAVVSNRRAAAAGRGVRCTVFRADETRATYFAALGVTHSALDEELRNESENKHRPISRNQSQEHVFFLTLGRMMCRDQGSETTPVIDGNRLFKSSPEFSSSFNCPPGSGMNPLQRCYHFHEHYANSL